MPGRNGKGGANQNLIAPSEDLSGYLLRQNEQVRSVISNSTSLISGFADLNALREHHETRFGATLTNLPYKKRPKGYVFHGGTLGLPELWCGSNECRKTCRRLFKRFVWQFFGIRMRTFPFHGVNADHVHPMTLARAEGQGYVRLLLSDAAVNQGWGSWEDNAMQNDPRFGKTMTFAHDQVLLKLSGYPHPKFPLDRAYVEEAVELLHKETRAERPALLHTVAGFLMTGMKIPHEKRLSSDPDSNELQARSDLFNKTRLKFAADIVPEYKPTVHMPDGEDDPD